jgi:uncharacterized protein
MKPFSLLIKPVSCDCTLECRYCFYKKTAACYPEHSTMMSKSTLEAILKQYLSLCFPVSSLCFQGGEPLLADPHLYHAIPELFDRYAHDGQTLEVSFQTNGVGITPEWTNLFALLHALVGVSLDGPENLHDAYRVTWGGNGTFTSVMNGIDLLRQDDIPFNILTMITDKSVGHADAIYTFFREQGFNWLQFIPCVETDLLTNELSEHSITGEGFERFYSTLFDRWFDNGYPDVSIRLFEDILFTLVDGVAGSCTHKPVCDGYLVIEYNGDVYPCDFFVDPAWYLGTIHRQPIAELLRHPLRLQFMQLKTEYASGCGNCKFNALCRGGCPKHYLYYNSCHTPRNHLCAGYHRFLDYTYDRFLELRDDILQRRNAR